MQITISSTPMVRLSIITIISMLLFAFSGCSTVPITGRHQLKLVSSAKMDRMSYAAFDQIVQSSKIDIDNEHKAELDRIIKRLTTVADEIIEQYGDLDVSYYKWDYRLIKNDDYVNAVCLPNGKIIIYSGILPIAKDENGLAVIMGHEIAHAIANHGREQVGRENLTGIFGTVLTTAISKNETERQQMMNMYNTLAQLGLLLPYSRVQEYEADRIGLILMAKAGYDPRAAIPFWERMMKRLGDNPYDFMSTHPASNKRIEQIRQLLPEALQYYHPEQWKNGKQS